MPSFLPLATLLVLLGALLGEFAEDFVEFGHALLCHALPTGPAFGRPDDKLRRSIQ